MDQPPLTVLLEMALHLHVSPYVGVDSTNPKDWGPLQRLEPTSGLSSVGMAAPGSGPLMSTPCCCEGGTTCDYPRSAPGASWRIDHNAPEMLEEY